MASAPPRALIKGRLRPPETKKSSSSYTVSPTLKGEVSFQNPNAKEGM